MKRIHVKCPICGAQAQLRPASVVHGDKTTDPNAKLYICARYPACDSYVAAHQKTGLPMGTLANKKLRRQRMEAHAALDHLMECTRMTRKETYRWLQLQLGLPEDETHIAMFSERRCLEVIRICEAFTHACCPAA